ncbi:MAG: MATE efflux family protein [Bacteroidetes bacterium]|nr:MAG: MATE efflux family protein [Bacteroidota bacterium]
MEVNISYKRIWSIAYPIILGSVAQNLINVTDTAFLGRVGEVELGASALGGMFYFVLFMLALGFGTGTQIIISRRHGEGNSHLIGKTFDHALYFMLPLSFVAFFILYFFSTPILRAVIESDSIFEASVAFLKYRMPGIFFVFGQILFRSFYIGIAKTKVITWSTLVMAGINIVLDYGLIFGKLGMPQMGLEGAAIASTIAEGVALAFLIVYVIYHQHHKKYHLFVFEGFDKELFYRNFKLSSPIMVQNFLSLGVWFAFFLIVEKLGEHALAVSNIIRSVYIVLMIPIWGFASAANSMVSYLIGMRKEAFVFLLLKRIVIMTTSGVFGLVILSLFVPEALIRIYTDNQELISMSVPVLRVVNIGAVFLATGFVLFNGVMGTGKTNISFVIEIAVLFLYLFYVLVVVNYLGGGVTIAWTAEILYGVLLSSFSLLYLLKGKWRHSSL